MESARDEHHWAKYRLNAAHDRLDGIGPFSLLRRHGRDEKSAALDAIEHFGRDVAHATAKVAAAEENLNELSHQVTQTDTWHTEHDWRRGRLTAIERELTDAGHIDLRRIYLPDRSPRPQLDRSRTSALESRLHRILSGEAPNHGIPTSSDRLAEIARPPLPGPDHGLGMDLGL